MAKKTKQEAQQERLSLAEKRNRQERRNKKSRKEREQEKRRKKQERDRRKQKNIPTTAQQSIPYIRMLQDGICQVTKTFFSKTIQFYDINYQLALNEDKTTIFENYCDFLNTLILPSVCSCPLSISRWMWQNLRKVLIFRIRTMTSMPFVKSTVLC